jgi:hypothetical protein
MGIEQRQESGSNSEVIIYSQTSPDKKVTASKDKIYGIISVLKYPMNKNPKNLEEIKELLAGSDKSPPTDKELLNRLCEGELAIIRNEVKEINGDAAIFCIPKSLYQLFVLLCFLKDATSLGNESVEDVWRKRYYSVDSNANNAKNGTVFAYGKVASATNNKDRQDAYFEYCKRYMASPKVRELFWKVNDTIIDFLVERGINTSTPLSEGSLEQITDKLLVDLQKLKCKLLDAPHDDDLKFAGMFRVDFVKDKQPILKILKNELGEMAEKGTNILYRGARAKPLYDYFLANGGQLSFSDAIFSSIISKDVDAMAYSFIKKDNHCFVAKIRKNEGINDKNDVSIFMPPISYLAQTNGIGEFHHPKVTVLRGGYIEKKRAPLQCYVVDSQSKKQREVWDNISEISNLFENKKEK